MNKPVAFVCGCITGIGLLILSVSTYLTIVYGRGDLQAGNFNQCWYLAKPDPQTRRVVYEWNDRGESTEDSIVERLDMWFVGIAFVVVGAGIHVTERYGRRKCYSF